MMTEVHSLVQGGKTSFPNLYEPFKVHAFTLREREAGVVDCAVSAIFKCQMLPAGVAGDDGEVRVALDKQEWFEGEVSSPASSYLGAPCDRSRHHSGSMVSDDHGIP